MGIQKPRTFFGVIAAIAFTLVNPRAAICAEDSPPTKADVISLMERRPLTAESWPEWRDYYVRLYYAYDVNEPEAFNNRLHDYWGAIAAENGGQLSSEFSDDPIAWILVSRHYLKKGDATQAEDASRKAVALNAPLAIGELNLAAVLLTIVRMHHPKELSSEDRARLDEVEKLLVVVEQTVPQAKLSQYFGMLDWNRNNMASAIRHLRQAALDHPYQPTVTIMYLSAWLSDNHATRPLTAVTDPCVQRFPKDPYVLAFHAVALHGDERFVEAYETLQRVRSLDEKAVSMLGDSVTSAIDTGRWITADAREGLHLQKKGDYRQAVIEFEKVLKDDPSNFLVARFLVRSLLASVHKPSDCLVAASRCASLCEQFPDDAELHLARAVALSRGNSPIEAGEALKRSQQLDGNVEKIAGAAQVRKIQKDAQDAELIRTISWGVLIGLVGVTGWIVVMFAVGSFLAMIVAQQADPDPLTISEDGLSRREIWVERTYLVTLTLALIIFYLSLPVVCLGLLAITLSLFLLLFVLRVIHVGILERGFYAVAGVIRSATIGPSREILGIEISGEQHPRLFEVMKEVADRLKTRPADVVYLTPLAEISVHDRGHGPFGLFGRRRVMQIGIPTFASLNVSELKSVLAHEFAHFSHRHTFYSRFIFQVCAPLSHSLAVMNAAGGAFNYVNPFYGFYWLYLKAFQRLAAGFSRSHEFLADRQAVFACGREAFQSSFTKICLESQLFQSTVVHTVHDGLRQGQAFINIFEAYRGHQEQPTGQEFRQCLLEELINERPSWHHSHPTYSQRLKAVESIRDSHHAADLNPSTKLLENIEAIETQLTEVLTRHIHYVLEASGQL